MKKLMTKSFIKVGLIAFGVFAGATFAQFGADVWGVWQIWVAGTANAAGTGTNLLDIIKSY